MDKKIFCLINKPDGFSVIQYAPKHNTEALRFKAFYIDELIDFSQSGILFEILKPLKENDISVLVVSAFSRDYIFVNVADFENARRILGI